jgi:hypothetical protein
MYRTEKKTWHFEKDTRKSMSKCALNRSNEDWTCFTVEELETMAEAWNCTKLGRKKSIILLNDEEEDEKVKRHYWEELRDRFFPYCGEEESCWLDNVEMGKCLKEKEPEMYTIINHFTLKPKGTKGRHEWLSTTEIDYVMQQYEDFFPDFKYLGCVPSDYYKLAPHKFPRKQLEETGRAALVFNLDEAHQRGSHWVAIFFWRDENEQLHVEYFDATGEKPNKNIAQFLKHPYFTDAKVQISHFKHQRGNNECGVYSLFFITERLQGTTFKEFQQERVSDSAMNNFRQVLFRPFSEPFTME